MYVANITQVEDDMRAHMKPDMSRSGRELKVEMLMIPSLTVLVVLAPSRMAPPNSVKMAMHTACHSLRDREPTDVAKELATSFAPAATRSKTQQHAK